MKQNYWTYNKPLSMTGFGGGATSLLNAGATGFDEAYDFFISGGSSLDFDNSSYSESTGSNVQQSTDFFIDHSQQKQWSSFTDVGYYNWNNGGSSYSGNADFYQFTPASPDRTAFASQATHGFQYEFRGITIAYLQDQTPVIVLGPRYNSSSIRDRLWFLEYPTGNLIGYLNLTTGGTGIPTSVGVQTGAMLTGLCYTGTHIIVMCTNVQYFYGYELPANTAAINSSSTITNTLRWDAGGTNHSHGLAFGGGNRIYVGHSDSTSSCFQYTLTNNGTSGTATYQKTYSLGSVNYSVAIDYKNKKLVLGGYSSSAQRVFGT
tara:strand:- start:3169 stop:4125 length:957 start_codon:yes stop_codon:yes gene_type:complete